MLYFGQCFFSIPYYSNAHTILPHMEQNRQNIGAEWGGGGGGGYFMGSGAEQNGEQNSDRPRSRTA